LHKPELQSGSQVSNPYLLHSKDREGLGIAVRIAKTLDWGWRGVRHKECIHTGLNPSFQPAVLHHQPVAEAVLISLGDIWALLEVFEAIVGHGLGPRPGVDLSVLGLLLVLS
jgi:hypothetical protein